MLGKPFLQIYQQKTSLFRLQICIDDKKKSLQYFFGLFSNCAGIN